MQGGFAPFGAHGLGGGGGGVSAGGSHFWDVKSSPSDPLVLDAWRHRQVPDAGRGSPTPPSGAQRSLGTLDATLSSLREDQRLGGHGGYHQHGGPPPMHSHHPVYGKAAHERPGLVGSTTASTAVSLGDLHLTQGTGYSQLSLDASVHAALQPQKSIAELSSRRRDAIKAAFRRIDVKGSGWATIQELAMGLQRFSNLAPMEQERVCHALTPPGARLGVDWNGQISFSTFAGYYQLLGSSVERDRDFEDLMRHHWGFAEVSDILDDMKNKFAMVGLAYAFRRGLEHGGSPEMSMEAFQEAISNVGMHYSSSDVHRLFDAFDPRGGSDGRSLEVLRLTQHLTSAPRPSTPIAPLYGSAHFSEVNSQAEELPSHLHAQHRLDQSGYGSFSGFRLGHVMEAPLAPGDKLPPTVPAPEESPALPEEHNPNCAPPQAPPEEDDALGPTAPPEREADGKHSMEAAPEAPPEDAEGDLAPPEKLGNPQDSQEAPRELDLGPGLQSPQHHRYHQSHHHHQAYSPYHHQLHHGHAAASPQHYAAHASPQHIAASPASPMYPASPQHIAASPAQAGASPSGGRRRAVTVGINYIGQKVQLAGCINDSDTFISLLTEDFGYSVADIRQLRDDHPQRMPTRKNITAALHWLVNGAKAGDHLFFHYSGHGSQQKDEDGDEDDGRDETLVPCDYLQNGMLSDDMMRRTLGERLPKGCRLTVIMDCCHSGTAMDLSYKVAIQDGGMVDIRKKPAHKLPPPLQADIVLLSGCMDTQTSADAGVGLAGNTKAAGAMTTAFKLVITKYRNGSYMKVLDEMRKFLVANKFSQVPQLSSDHAICLSDCFMPEAEAAKPLEPPATAQRPPVRKALTIGINYLTLWPGRGRLSGCINDSETMMGILKDTFGFDDSQICRLRDDRANMMPTKANILASLRWLTQGAGPNDELFLHYSGHGGQKADTNGDEESGKDDTLIPCDFQTAGQITDDELREHVVQHLPKGCRLWVLLDCCHSGTALDLMYKVNMSEDGKSCKMMQNSAKNIQPSQGEVIMISGCKDTQTSADVAAGSMGAAKAAGAMTTAFRHCINPTIAIEDLLNSMRSFLKRNGYKQVPQMSSEKIVQLDAPFVQYEGKSRNKRESADTRSLPMMDSSLMSSSPQNHYGGGGAYGPSPPAATAPLSPMGMAVTPSHQAATAPLSPMGMAVTPSHQVHADTDKYVMDSRINKLEGQIAEMRAQHLQQQHSPLSWQPPPGSPLHLAAGGATPAPLGLAGSMHYGNPAFGGHPPPGYN